MREFLKKVFSRRPPQQLGLEVGSRSASARVRDDDDYSWLDPPISLVDPAPWDMYWYEHLRRLGRCRDCKVHHSGNPM